VRTQESILVYFVQRPSTPLRAQILCQFEGSREPHHHISTALDVTIQIR